MKFTLDKDKLTIVNNKPYTYNSGSVDYYEAEVQFDETWNDLTIEAIITKMGENKGISRSPINNKIMLDLQENGTYTVGFVGYKIENEEKIYQISTNLDIIQYEKGAGEIETENEPILTPTEWEIYIAQIQDMIDNIQTDYIPLRNKPKINNIELTGNKSLHELGIQREGNYALEEDIPTTLAELSEDSTHRTVTDTEKTTWNNKSDFSGSYNDLSNKPTIPDELKDLSDDSTHRTVTDTEKTTWNNKSDFSGSYNDLSNKPTIPDELKDLTDDSTHRTVTDTEKTTWNNKAEVSDIPDVSNFITKDVNNLTNYTLKTNTGSLINLEINDTTYVVTLKLKNQDGTIISTDTIDLPLESVVVSGRYDNTTKKVILTLENGSEVDFSVADLVAGLQTEITNQNKLASDLVDDTNSGNKFVTTSEKQTWNNKYDKPNGGIPKTDLASDVQTSLGKADTALQEHQDISGKENKTNKVTSIDNTSTDTQYPSAKCVHDSQATQDDEIEALQTENERLKATLPTTTGEGQDITLDKTAEMEFVKPPLPRGNSEQEGEPSPDNEVPITNVTGNVEVTISNNDNSESKTLPVSLGNIELCKLGNYQDYLYKNNGKWYKHNAINKLVLNGSENWSISNNVFYLASISDYINSSGKICLSDKYTAINNTDVGTLTITQNNSICFFITNTNPRLYIRDERFNNVNAFKAELSENNVKVYYSTVTPTDTEITDATLISQLEEISKTLSYQGQTNITSNTIALFNVEAYQDTKIVLNEKYSKPSTGIPKTDLASSVQTSLNKANSAIQEHQDISRKQDITDNTLTTINKTVPTAINEVNSIAKLANQAKSYSTYQAFINYLNTAEKTEFIPGQSFMIQTKLVPDLWVYSVENTSVQYTYTTDEDFITYTNQATGGQVGYYKLAQLETQKVDLTDYATKTYVNNLFNSIVDGDEVSY